MIAKTDSRNWTGNQPIRHFFAFSLNLVVQSGYVEKRIGTRMKRNRKDGFTLVEIMIVIMIVALLATMGIPSYVRARAVSTGVRVANDLRVFGQAFAVYAIENGNYPADSHEVLPSAPGIEEYIRPSKFNEETAIGGRYNWEGPDTYPYAGVSVSGSSISISELEDIDRVVDDGDLSTGNFQRPSSGRYTYIIEE